MTPLDTATQDAITRAAALMARARHTVVLAGAGMSKESGIPTFRGDGGLWTIHGEPPLNQFETFSMDPRRWWERRLEDPDPNGFASSIDQASPNAGHAALVELERMDVVRHVISQNVDDSGR